MSSLNGQFRVLIFKYFKINQSFLTFFGKIPLEASQALNTCQKCGKMKNYKCPPFRLMCTAKLLAVKVGDLKKSLPAGPGPIRNSQPGFDARRVQVILKI